jgi:hypothetical protein
MRERDGCWSFRHLASCEKNCNLLPSLPSSLPNHAQTSDKEKRRHPLGDRATRDADRPERAKEGGRAAPIQPRPRGSATTSSVFLPPPPPPPSFPSQPRSSLIFGDRRIGEKPLPARRFGVAAKQCNTKKKHRHDVSIHSPLAVLVLVLVFFLAQRRGAKLLIDSISRPSARQRKR